MPHASHFSGRSVAGAGLEVESTSQQRSQVLTNADAAAVLAGSARHWQDADAAGAAGDPGAHLRHAPTRGDDGPDSGVRGHQRSHGQHRGRAARARHQRHAHGPASQGAPFSVSLIITYYYTLLLPGGSLPGCNLFCVCYHQVFL